MSWFSRLFESTSGSKRTSLLDAVRSGNLRVAESHFQAGADPNEKLDGERSYLHYAVGGGIEIVGLLVRHGANVDAPNEQGATPIHIAAGEGYAQVVELLIKSSANVNAIDGFGHTPLFTALAHASAYERLQAAPGTPPEDRAIRAREGRKAAAALLKIHGGRLSEIDV